MKTIKIDMPRYSLLERATYVDRNIQGEDDGGVFERTTTTHVYRVIEFENEEELEMDIRDRIENPRADYDYQIVVLQIIIDGEEIDANEYWEKIEEDVFEKMGVKTHDDEVPLL